MGKSSSSSPWPYQFWRQKDAWQERDVSFIDDDIARMGHFIISLVRPSNKQATITQSHRQDAGQFPHIRHEAGAHCLLWQSQGKIYWPVPALALRDGKRPISCPSLGLPSPSTGLDVPISRRCNKTCVCSSKHLFSFFTPKFSCSQAPEAH